MGVRPIWQRFWQQVCLWDFVGAARLLADRRLLGSGRIPILSGTLVYVSKLLVVEDELRVGAICNALRSLFHHLNFCASGSNSGHINLPKINHESSIHEVLQDSFFQNLAISPNKLKRTLWELQNGVISNRFFSGRMYSRTTVENFA